MFKKNFVISLLAVALCCMCIAPAWGQAGVGSFGCRQVQLDAQAAVTAGEPFKNHGKRVSAAAAVVEAAVAAGTIDAECASCIMHQFGQGIPIAEQEACGPDSPNPECEGATCATFIPCNPESSCGTPVCGTLAEGGGLCVEGSTPCAGLVLCPGGTGDCPAGSLCFVNSCCGDPVCVPPEAFCPVAGGAAAASAVVVPGTRTFGNTGN